MSRRWIVVALIFTGIMISYIDRGNLGIAAPVIMRDFGLSSSSMGMLLSAFFWTYAVFQLPAGAIVDRFGIRWVYAVAFVLWSLASAAIGLSRGLSDILLLRMLLGLAESVGPIASLSFIRRNFSGEEVGLPTSIYITGQNLGPAVGALLGSQLVAHFGWRSMFLCTGLGALAWLPAWIWLAPQDRRNQVAATSTVPFSDLPWSAVLTMRAFWAVPLCVFLSSYYWYFVLTWVPTYLITTRGFSTTEMGRVLSTPLFTMAILNIPAGLVADRLVKHYRSVFRVRLWVGAAAYAAASGVLLLLWLPQKEAVLPVLIWSVCGIAIGNSNYWAIAQETAPAHLVGRTIGFLNTVSQIAGAAAPLITGWVLGPDKQFAVALSIAGICPIIAAVCLVAAGSDGLQRLKDSLSGVKVAPQQPYLESV